MQKQSIILAAVSHNEDEHSTNQISNVEDVRTVTLPELSQIKQDILVHVLVNALQNFIIDHIV